MNRYETIDSFLKYIRDIELQNPGFVFSKDQVYHELVRIGVPPQEQNFSLPRNGLFDRWIQRFVNKENINVFVSPNWQYFCQFTNNESMLKSAPEHIKVYVPQDATHIEQSANMIFDFLAQNNIPHLSKIGSAIRFDDIVIRLINPEDEIKLRQFINSNQYIQSGLIPANPFLFQKDGIALACDGRISFNSTVAKYIILYMQARKGENKLDRVGIADFYNFVEEYYQKTFITKTNIKNVKQQLDIGNNSIANYMNVTELILKSIDRRFEYDDYIDHFKKCSNTYLIEQQDRALESCYYNAVNNNKIEKTERLITAEERQEVNRMLTRMINVLAIRYQSETFIRIQKYLETGNVYYMPSDDPNLRGDLDKSNFRETLKLILENDKISLNDYIAKINNPVQNTNNRQIDPQKVNELLTFAYQELCKKYGHDQAITNLEGYLRNGDPALLTRSGGVRQIITASSFREDMAVLLNGSSLSIYIENVILNQGKTKDDYLREALMTTYQKYEAAYQSGASNISGSHWISSALKQLIDSNSYTGFTRDNQVRENLQANVSSDDALEIITKFYGVDTNQTLTDEALRLYITTYISDVISQVNSYQY